MPEKAFWKYEIKYYFENTFCKIHPQNSFVFFNYTYYVGVRSPDTYICAWGQQVDSSGVCVRLMRCAAVPYIIFGMQINTGTGIGLVIGY